MGRKRLPDATKAMRGTLRKSRSGNVDVEKPAGVPAAPSWLTELALAEWSRVAPELWRNGLLTELDVVAFGGYCESYADYVRCQQEIAKCGMTIRTAAGNFVQHPALGLANRAFARFIRAGQLFGLSPAARSGLKVAPPKANAGGKKSMAEKYMSGPAVLPMNRTDDAG